MVFHWSLSDIKSPQVPRTLLSILAVLNNVVVWMVSTRPPTSKSSSFFSNPLVTVPNVPIAIGIIITCMFHSFFHSRGTLLLLSLLLLLLGVYLFMGDTAFRGISPVRACGVRICPHQVMPTARFPLTLSLSLFLSLSLHSSLSTLS